MVIVIDLQNPEASEVRELDPFEVISCANKGMTAQEAADHLGFSMWYVRNTARELGVKFRDPRAWTEEDKALARELAGQGKSYRQIAQAVGKSYSGVRKMLTG